MEETIAVKILANLIDRRGLSQAWDQIDSDIQSEIFQGLVEIVRSVLSGNQNLSGYESVLLQQLQSQDE